MDTLQDREKLLKSLQTILDSYGTLIFKDPDRLNALLMDYMPEYQNERKILMDVIKLGVAEELLSVREKSAEEIAVAVRKCYALIDSTLMIKETAAEYTVTLLADALRINIPHTSKNKSASPKKADSQISQAQPSISLKDEPVGKYFMALTCLLIAIFALCEWNCSQISASTAPIRGNLGIAGTALCSIIALASCAEICKTGNFKYILVFLAAVLPPLNLTVLSTVLPRDFHNRLWVVIYVIFLALILIIIALSSSLEKKQIRLSGQSQQNPEELLRISKESIWLKYLMGIEFVTLYYAIGIGNLRAGFENISMEYGGILVLTIISAVKGFSIDKLGTGHLGYILLHGLLTLIIGWITIAYLVLHQNLYADAGNILWIGLGLYHLAVAILSFRIYKKRNALPA